MSFETSLIPLVNSGTSATSSGRDRSPATAQTQNAAFSFLNALQQQATANTQSQINAKLSEDAQTPDQLATLQSLSEFLGTLQPGTIGEEANVQTIADIIGQNTDVLETFLDPLAAQTLTLPSGENAPTIPFTDILNINTSDREGIYEAAGLLDAVIAKHQALQANSVATAVNLTPEELTLLINHLEAGEEDTLDSLPTEIQALVAQLIPPAHLAEPTKQTTQQQQQSASTADAVQKAEAELARSLNSLTVGGTGDDTLASDVDIDGEQTRGTFKDTLKASKGGDLTAQQQNTKTQTQAQTQNTNAQTPPTNAATIPADIANTLNWYDTAQMPEWLQARIDQISGAVAAPSATGIESLSNPVTSSSFAGQTNSGTQLVAMTLQKNAADGTNKSITLRLDPPELGRVEVKMTFDKDQTMKALLSIEKPETLAMLQRDLHVLERALSDLGLDTNGSISMELANDNQDFGQDGRHDGSRNQFGNRAANDGEENIDIIDSTMTWQIDPNTGHTRYQIWA